MKAETSAHVLYAYTSIQGSQIFLVVFAFWILALDNISLSLILTLTKLWSFLVSNYLNHQEHEYTSS
jgi:hypothetical protein